MTARVVKGLVERLHTAGAVGTVPVAQAGGTLLMLAPAPAAHAPSHAGGAADPITSLGAHTLTGDLTMSGDRSVVLADDSPTSLLIGSSGLLDLMKFDTSNGAEGVVIKGHVAIQDALLDPDIIFNVDGTLNMGTGFEAKARGLVMGATIVPGGLFQEPVGLFADVTIGGSATLPFPAAFECRMSTAATGAWGGAAGTLRFPAVVKGYWESDVGSVSMGAATVFLAGAGANILGGIPNSFVSGYNAAVVGVSGCAKAIGFYSYDQGIEGVTNAYGALLEQSLFAVTNYGIHLNGHGEGADIVFGTNSNAQLATNGADYFIDADHDDGGGETVILGGLHVGDDSSLGAELVTNGTFTGSATGWTLGSWVYGTNNINHPSGNVSVTQAVSGFVVGHIYKVQLTLSVVSGAGNVGYIVAKIMGWESKKIGSNGTHTFYFRADATSGTLDINARTNLIATMDDVTIREVQGGDLSVIGNFGCNNQAPATPQTYTPTNVTTDRSYDANATTVNELADVIGTLVADLQATGLIA